jgi:CubicO group peptidase (beta-lactamase class C family)
MQDNTDRVVARLQELFSDLTARRPVEQAIVAVENGDRSFRWIETHGESEPNGDRVSEETPFFIASIDKLYNATIAMLLSETGRLDLDELIVAYLPRVVTRELGRFRGADHSERITVRHLLSHTSGLADWLADYPRAGPSLLERVLEEGDRTITLEELASMVGEQLKPHFPPQDLSANRAQVRYSDTNFMLLIGIIEAVTGQPLHIVHEQLLYRPLGLRHTYFPGLSKPLDPTPAPMPLRSNGQLLNIPLLMRSINGIYSTVGDALTFLRRFVRDEIFQRPDTLPSMQTMWRRLGLPLDRAALRSPGWPIEYGLGIMRLRLPRILTSMQLLPPVVGHTGSTGCWLFWCPAWDLYLVGSVDEVTGGAIPYRMVPKILSTVRSSI